MSQQDSSAPTSKLAIGALASVFFCPPFALIFAIIALVRIAGSNGRLGGKTIAIVAICLNLATVPVVAILAAIAVPSFVKYQCKSKQSEAKTNLRALAVQQAQFLAVRGEYSGDPAAIHFRQTGTRYQYAIVSADKTSFVAEAKGYAAELSGDIWRITNNNDLVNVTDRCR